MISLVPWSLVPDLRVPLNENIQYYQEIPGLKDVQTFKKGRSLVSSYCYFKPLCQATINYNRGGWTICYIITLIRWYHTETSSLAFLTPDRIKWVYTNIFRSGCSVNTDFVKVLIFPILLIIFPIFPDFSITFPILCKLYNLFL